MGFFPHGKFGLLSLRKAICDSRATQPQLMTSLVWAVFLCDHTTGCEAYSFTTDAYNVRTNLEACCSHARGSGTNKFVRELTRRDRKLFLTLPHPTRGSNPHKRLGYCLAIKLLKKTFSLLLPHIPHGPPSLPLLLQFSSVQFKMVSMRSGRPICAPPRLTGVSPMLPLKQFQCWSD